MTLDDTILKYALQNALKFKGKANPGNVIPKIMGDDPSLKSKIKEIIPQINKIVKGVNELSLDQQKEKLLSLAPELLEKKEVEKKGLKELPNVGKDGTMTTQNN
jgi:glutamyl-tRNA synthetase